MNIRRTRKKPVFDLFANDTVEETVDFLTCVTREWEKEEPSFYEFAILLNDLLIGAVLVYLDEKREVGELDRILNKKYQKMRYATEAARAIIDFAFNALCLKKVFAECDYRNVLTYQLMERIGIKQESDKDMRFYPKGMKLHKN